MMDARSIFALLIAGVLAGCGTGETCSQRATCPSGNGSFELCTTGSSSCRYVTSDGKSFDCGSCADCQQAASQALAWCSGGGGDGGSGAGCVTTTVCANSAKDCAAGQRCNTALNPPVCQALYCGAGGSVCAGDSADDLCASRVCQSGRCVGPSSGPDGGAGDGGASCCQPGNPGNELGVGKYCAMSSQCTGQANVCTAGLAGNTSGFCTMLCTQGSDCGSNATCQCSSSGSGSGCACVPTGCSFAGC